jgi:quercetin dioxygenase-like cupin family protein
MPMKVSSQGLRASYEGRFTGPVELEMLAEADDETRPDVARVHFEAHAVTKWHSHPGGQLLYLVGGTGRVGNEENRVRLSAGALVVTPPGERHWHGAADERAVFLAVTWGTTVWEDAAPDIDESV